MRFLSNMQLFFLFRELCGILQVESVTSDNLSGRTQLFGTERLGYQVPGLRSSSIYLSY